MMISKKITRLERQGWDALSDSIEATQPFYGKLLHPECRMVFPGGIILQGRDKIMESFSTQPWSDYTMEDVQIIQTHPDIAIIVYRITAQRQGSATYRATVASTYQRADDQWQLLFHQQTSA